MYLLFINCLIAFFFFFVRESFHSFTHTNFPYYNNIYKKKMSWGPCPWCRRGEGLIWLMSISTKGKRGFFFLEKG